MKSLYLYQTHCDKFNGDLFRQSYSHAVLISNPFLLLGLLLDTVYYNLINKEA